MEEQKGCLNRGRYERTWPRSSLKSETARAHVISHLFFDLDGTRTNPRDGIVRCIVHALTTIKASIPADDVLKTFIGPPVDLTFETLLAPGMRRF